LQKIDYKDLNSGKFLKSISSLLDAVGEGAKMLIQPAYISYLRRNKPWRYFKL